MPYTLTMPKLSPTMAAGTLVKWHKKEGDKVESGDLLIEVSTDKASVEHHALDEGYLRKVLVAEGESAEVNQPIAVFTEKKDESIDGYQPAGVVVKSVGVREEKKSEAKVQKEVKVSVGPAKMEQGAFIPEPPLENYAFTGSAATTGERIIASPLARKLAKEKGLDLSSLKGSGPNQRIMSRDLERAQHTGTVAFGQNTLPKEAPGSYVEEALSPMRKVICQRMQEAKTFIPHFYVNQTINAEPLIAARQQLREMKAVVSYNDFIIRACALALREHPHINSGFNSVNQTIIRFKTIDISVAVSIPEGLMTPIIRHADYKNVGEISMEVRSLAKRAKEGKLKIEEFKGGSFTISNLGMYGVTDFQAIINAPQAAILAVSGVVSTPVVKEGAVIPGKTFNISLSSDHRVIDGVAAAKFISTVQRFLENPASLLI